MIASENFAPGPSWSAGLGADQQVRGGYPGRYPAGAARRRRRAAAHRPGQGPVLARSPPTSSTLGRPAPTPPRWSPCSTRATPSWASTWPGGHLTHGMKINFSGKLYRVVPTGPSPNGPPDRTRPRIAARRRAPAQADRGRLVGVPAPARLRRVPRIADEVGACLWSTWRTSPGSWRPGCTPARCRTPTSSRPRPIRRSAARRHTIPCREGVQGRSTRRRLPGPAGVRHARHRRKGAWRSADRRHAGTSRSQQRTLEGGPGSSRPRLAQLERRPTASPCSPAAPTSTSSWSTCATPSSTASRPRTACTRSASRQPQRRAVRPAPADGHERPAHRHAGARERTSAPRRSPRSPTSSHRARSRPRHRPASTDRDRHAEPGRQVTALAGPLPPSTPTSTRPSVPVSSAPIAAPGADLPEHPDFLWRNPDPKRHYDVVIVGGGGHGLATAYYLAKNHGITNVAVLEKGWLAGGNMARNTTIIRSNYLWDESRHLRARAEAVGDAGRGARLRPPVQPARRAEPRPHPADIRDSRRRVTANRLNGVDAECLDPERGARRSARSRIEPEHPLPGARRHLPAAGRHRQARLRRLGLRPRADELGVDLIQNCEVTGIDHRGRAGPA